MFVGFVCQCLSALFVGVGRLCLLVFVGFAVGVCRLCLPVLVGFVCWCL